MQTQTTRPGDSDGEPDNTQVNIDTMNTTTNTRRKDIAKSLSDPIRSLGKVVSIASFGLFVIILVKYVDGRYHCESETAAQATLVLQSTNQQLRLERYENDAIRMQAELKQLDEQSVTYAELNLVQDHLLALARRYSCTLKKASPRVKGTIDFKTRLNTKDNESNRDGPDDALPEFELQQAGLSLNLSGDLDHLIAFMKAIREQAWFVSTDQLTLRREANIGGNMALEIELNFLSLQPKRTSEFGESPSPRA